MDGSLVPIRVEAGAAEESDSRSWAPRMSITRGRVRNWLGSWKKSASTSFFSLVSSCWRARICLCCSDGECAICYTILLEGI